jgi:hypothetical protein
MISRYRRVKLTVLGGCAAPTPAATVRVTRATVGYHDRLVGG